MDNSITIGGRKVSNHSKTLIIAEVGINHDGIYENAIKMIDVAKNAGADVVKFQFFKSKKMYTEKATNFVASNGNSMPINAILKSTEVPENWINKLISYCKKVDIGFLSTICDINGVEVLERLGVDAFKIASSEITDTPLIERAAQTNKSIIFSCGGAYLSDIDKTLRLIHSVGNHNVAMLHCLYTYPTPLENCNLNFISTLKYAYPNTIIGYSDHTKDPIKAPITAVILGAKIIEKHFTLDKTLPGADHSFSLNPNELKEMCCEIRKVEQLSKEEQEKYICKEALGTSGRLLYQPEKEEREYSYRKIFAISNIQEGELLTTQNIDVLRPAELNGGISPDYYYYFINHGIRTVKPIKKGEPVTWDSLLSK